MSYFLFLIHLKAKQRICLLFRKDKIPAYISPDTWAHNHSQVALASKARKLLKLHSRKPFMGYQD